MLFVLAVNDADFLTFVGVVMHNHVVKSINSTGMALYFVRVSL
jgi:hypothetical protein